MQRALVQPHEERRRKLNALGKGGRGKNFIHKSERRTECMRTLQEKGLHTGIWSEQKNNFEKSENKKAETQTQSFGQQWIFHIKRYGDFHWEILLLICH